MHGETTRVGQPSCRWRTGKAEAEPSQPDTATHRLDYAALFEVGSKRLPACAARMLRDGNAVVV
jgi:hypothetical protein